MFLSIDLKKFMCGGKLALPIVAGYIPLGIACGVICTNAGITVFQSVVMSLFVFAGAGQYIAGAMYGEGASFVAITITTLIVNARHLLYTSALFSYVSNWSWVKKALFSAEITDETFGLHSSIFLKSDADYSVATGINVISHASWIFGNFLGALFGSYLGKFSNIGLDYALVALFIALLVPRLNNFTNVIVAIIAGIISLFATLIGIAYWGVVFAGIVAATIGLLIVEHKRGK